jgi:hypothetical protein
MPSDRASLNALKNILSEVDLILETCPPLPQNRTGRSRELLRAALALTDDLISQVGKTAGEVIGHKGGSATAHRFGPDHRSLRVTPAMEAGITDRIWTITELRA